MTMKQRISIISPLIILSILSLAITFKNISFAYDVVAEFKNQPPTVEKTLTYLSYVDGSIKVNKGVFVDYITNQICSRPLSLIYQPLFSFITFSCIPFILLQFKLYKDYSGRYGKKDPEKVEAQINKGIHILRVYPITVLILAVTGLIMANNFGLIDKYFISNIRASVSASYELDSNEDVASIIDICLIQGLDKDGNIYYFMPEELFGTNPIPSEITFKPVDIKLTLSETSSKTYTLEVLNEMGLNTTNLSDTKYYLYCKE